MTDTMTSQNIDLSSWDTLYISAIKTDQLMLYSDIIAVRYQIHTKHINTLCGQHVLWILKHAVRTVNSVRQRFTS